MRHEHDVRSATPPAKEPTIFVERLADLEREALPDIVPGEVDQWCARVSRRLAELADLWPTRRERRKALFQAIRRRDPGLHARVDTLTRDEDALRNRYAELRESVQTRCDDVESPDPYAAANTARDDVLDWIAALRKHDAEVDTWLAESHYRDRGFSSS